MKGNSQDLVGRNRPTRWDEVVGQARTVDMLRTFVTTPGLRPPAIGLFGQAGIGKTTLARLYAYTLMCEELRGADACGACLGCRNAPSLVVELDAAKDRSVEGLRFWINHAAYNVIGQWRTFILDEVAGLPPTSQNALLKALEDTPPDSTWILVTTEPGKLLRPLRSRLTSYNLKPVPDEEVTQKLREIAAKEGIAIGEESLAKLVELSAGCVRDAVKNLPLAAAEALPSEQSDEITGFAETFIEAAIRGDLGRCRQVARDEIKRTGEVPRLLGAIADGLVDMRGSSELLAGKPRQTIVGVLERIGEMRQHLAAGTSDPGALVPVAAMLSRLGETEEPMGQKPETGGGRADVVAADWLTRECPSLQSSGKPLIGKGGKVFDAKPCGKFGCSTCGPNAAAEDRAQLQDSGVQVLAEIEFGTPGSDAVLKKRVDRILSKFGASAHAWYMDLSPDGRHRGRIWMRPKADLELDRAAFERAVHGQDGQASTSWRSELGDGAVLEEFLAYLSSARPDSEGAVARELQDHLAMNGGHLVRGSHDFFRNARGEALLKREVARAGTGA